LIHPRFGNSVDVEEEEEDMKRRRKD